MSAPSWLSLLSTLPDNAVVEKKPVASADQLANNSAGPITGWQSVTVNLSEPACGLRDVFITLNGAGICSPGSDHVMFVPTRRPTGSSRRPRITKASAGDLKRRCVPRPHWKTTLVGSTDDEESSVTRSAEQRPPTGVEIVALRRIIDDVFKETLRTAQPTTEGEP